MKYYFLYQITNLTNNKIYIGAHETKNLNDGYMGSGVGLIRDMEILGFENFKKEILEFFVDRKSMYLKEEKIVDTDFVKREDTYNICPGGKGGFHYLNSTGLSSRKGSHHTEETKRILAEKASLQICTEEKRHNLSKNNWSKRNPEAHKQHIKKLMTGIPKSEEHKKKLALANSDKTIYHWVNKNGTEEYCSGYDLLQKYDNLSALSISKLKHNKQIKHKGWFISKISMSL